MLRKIVYGIVFIFFLKRIFFGHTRKMSVFEQIFAAKSPSN